MPETANRLRVVVDREACMGSGMCIVYAPGTFSHDDEAGNPVAAAFDPPGDDEATVRAAVDACPMGALSLVPTEGEG
jgi:ferredoxin